MYSTGWPKAPLPGLMVEMVERVERVEMVEINVLATWDTHTLQLTVIEPYLHHISLRVHRLQWVEFATPGLEGSCFSVVLEKCSISGSGDRA